MKQKNLILIAVAVGCGLVAAVLTSQMSAGQKKQDDFVEIPVASRDLSVQTKLSKSDIQNYVEYKKFNKDSLPPEFAANTDEIADKRLTRSLRKGEPFNPKDLTTKLVISPPPGFNVITFSANAPEAVAGFAGPGSKVDVIASVTMRSKKGQPIVFPLFIDMLVLAIDTKTVNESEAAIPALSMVSMAATPKQGLMLQGAISRGAQMRLMLRNSEAPPVWNPIPTEKEIWEILSDRPDNSKGGNTEDGNEPTTEKPEPKNVVKVPVPTENLPAGTQLTADIIESKFKMTEFTPPAPTAAVLNLREHVGKYLLKDVIAEQFLPRTYLGDKPEETKPAPMAEAGPTPKPEPKLPDPVKPADPKVDPKTPKVEAKKPVYLDSTVQGPNGIKKYRYQKLDNGEFKFLGIVREDGTVQEAPVPGSAQPPVPAAPPAPAPAVPTEGPNKAE